MDIKQAMDLLHSEDALSSSTAPSETDSSYRWNPGSFVILILFVATQILIWGFFIFCYFSRGKRHAPPRRFPSIAVIDLPPDYEVVIKTQFPVDPDPPSYIEACACASGSQLTIQQLSPLEKSSCSCIV